MPMPDDTPASLIELMAAFETIAWLLPLTGFVEVFAGILFMIPKYRALGAIMMFPIMLGILLIHTVNEPSGLPIALPLFLINLWAIIEHKDQYLALIKKP